MAINFYTEDTKFHLTEKKIIKESIKELIKNEKKRLGNINYIFVSNNKILDINIQYLSHDYFTDIITFDYCAKKEISGDLFISIDCVKDNAKRYNVTFENELVRVLAHGVLHLLGYNDKSIDEQTVMRKMEDDFITLFQEKIKNTP